MKFAPVDISLSNGKTILLREAVKADAKDLIVAAKSYLQTSDYLSLYEIEFNPSKQEEKEWIESHTTPNSLLLIAIYEKEIIATFNISGFQNAKMRHVGMLGISVLREWRGLGLGNLIFEQMVKWAKTNPHLEIISLEVFSDNTSAIALYGKHGFEIEGRRKNCFKDRKGNYSDNILMTLHLKQSTT